MLNIVNYSESSSSESDSEDDKGEAAGETDTLEEKKRSAEADVMASPKRQKRNNDRWLHFFSYKINNSNSPIPSSTRTHASPCWLNSFFYYYVHDKAYKLESYKITNV